MARKLIALVAGVFAGGLTVLIVEVIAHELVVPQRNGVPTTEMLGFVALAWLLGSLAAAFVAQRIDHSRRPLPALLAAGVLFAAAVWNLATLPHPLWFRIVGVLVFLPGAVLGIFFARRMKRRPAK